VRKLRATMMVTAVGALLALVGCGSGSQDSPTLLNGPVIVTGVSDDTPGFAVGDLNPAGFDIDLLNAIGAALHEPIQHTPITNADRATELQNQEATIIIDSYSITRARNVYDQVDFAGPYMISTQAVLVRADDARFPDDQHITKDDMAGKTVCTVATTTGVGVNIPGTIMGTPGTIKPTEKACVDALLSHNSDAVFEDTLEFYGFVHAYPGQLRVILPGVFGELQYYGVGLPAHHHADCLKLNQIITTYLRTQWRTDFLAALPSAAAAFPGNDTNGGDFESEFKPTTDDMTRLSCKL
jgi:glutamate transport system substrate-binding protein